ncbi:MAG: MBL fold metallo-hydrolase [Halobacteriaceae archaeon]
MEIINLTLDANVFTSNAFLVTGDRTMVIDAGAMSGIVNEIYEHVSTIDALVLTHQHGDHVEQLDSIVDEFDSPVYAYAEHSKRTHPIEDGDEIAIGDQEYEVIHTPGHASDHVALASETTLFSGDVVVHDDAAFEGGSFGRTDLPGQSRDVLIESLETLLKRLNPGVSHMYAGHGDDFHGDVEEIIETALERARRHEPKYPD